MKDDAQTSEVTSCKHRTAQIGVKTSSRPENPRFCFKIEKVLSGAGLHVRRSGEGQRL